MEIANPRYIKKKQKNKNYWSTLLVTHIKTKLKLYEKCNFKTTLQLKTDLTNCDCCFVMFVAC